MNRAVGEKFREWTRGKSSVSARISVYSRVRDFPYAVIPELNDGRRYVDILKVGRGSCSPKHLLLGSMFEALGLTVFYAVYPFRWDDFGIDYPDHLRSLARELPPSRHLACRVEIEGKLVLVDATLDPALRPLGLPMDDDWDGFSDTQLPMHAIAEEELYSASEARLMRSEYDKKALVFYRELNAWLDEVRRSGRLEHSSKGGSGSREHP